MKYTILSLFLVAASAANAQEQYVSVACRGGGFFSTKTQLFFSSDGFDVQKIPNSLTVSGRRVLASKATSQDPSCSYDYFFTRFEDLHAQPIDPTTNPIRPEEPIDIPPCLFPGQYPYCLPIHGVAAMAEDLAENSHTPFDEVATPFYEIRNFNALDFRTAAAPSLYSCAAGSSVTPISKADLAVALTKLYVARLVISKSGRVVAENESDVTAIQCLSFKNLN